MEQQQRVRIRVNGRAYYRIDTIRDGRRIYGRRMPEHDYRAQPAPSVRQGKEELIDAIRDLARAVRSLASEIRKTWERKR